MDIRTKYFLEDKVDKHKHGDLMYDTIVDNIVFWLDSIEEAKGLKVKDAILIHIRRSISENNKILDNKSLTFMLEDGLTCFLNEIRRILYILSIWIADYKPLKEIMYIFYQFESKLKCILHFK